MNAAAEVRMYFEARYTNEMGQDRFHLTPENEIGHGVKLCRAITIAIMNIRGLHAAQLPVKAAVSQSNLQRLKGSWKPLIVKSCYNESSRLSKCRDPMSDLRHALVDVRIYIEMEGSRDAF